jgi:hypothetical protein
MMGQSRLTTMHLSSTELSCVPVGNRLVKASRLYFRLTQDLAPFMFEVCIPLPFFSHSRCMLYQVDRGSYDVIRLWWSSIWWI